MSLPEMSFCGSILIIAIIIIRSIAINKLPKKTFIILWAIVLLRLFIPFDIPSKYSIHNLFDQHVNTAYETLTKDFAANIVTAQNPAVGTAENSTLNSQNQTGQSAADIKPQYAAPAVVQTQTSTAPVWPIIWITGSAALALYFFITYTRCTFAFKTARPVLNTSVNKWLDNQTLRRNVRLMESANITAPLTYGVFCPVILLPQNMDFEDEWQMKYVLAHEFAHIKHFDTLLKLTAIAALCVHWFNPFVWVMVALLNRDIELRCDEYVIAGFGSERKKAYAHMLINMEEKRTGLSSLMSSFSKNAAAERIAAIMKFKRVTAFTALTAALVIAVTGVAFATSSYPAAGAAVKSEISSTTGTSTVSDIIKTVPAEPPQEDSSNTAGYNYQSAQGDNYANPANTTGSDSNLREDGAFEDYFAKKAELEKRNDALDLEEDNLEQDYKSGKIDLKTYKMREAELDRLDDELEAEEDALEIKYGIDD